jgi:nucleotide-binding universal stress UspA family protein
MGIQNRLEALARGLRTLNRSAQAILLFGKPEQVLRERAEEIEATLIAIALNGSPTDRVQKKLAEILSRKCSCPVLTLAPDIQKEGPQSPSFPSHPAQRLVS